MKSKLNQDGKKPRKLKPKSCRFCKVSYTPSNSLQFVCSPGCAIEYAKDKQLKKQKREIEKYEARRRKAHSEAKERIKTKSDYNKLAQAAFNAFVRLRDLSEPCISCGRTVHEVESSGYSRGGHWDAGHYLSRGARPELRFAPENCHKQCKSCNGGAGKYAKKNYTVTQQYRLNLIAKIGLSRVEKLESDHRPRRYTKEDLKRIAKIYRKKLKKLKLKLDI